MPNAIDCVRLCIAISIQRLSMLMVSHHENGGYLCQRSTIIFQTILTNESSFNEAISLKCETKCSFGHFIGNLMVRREPPGKEKTKGKGSASQLCLGTTPLNPKPPLKKNLPLTIINKSKQCQMGMIDDTN